VQIANPTTAVANVTPTVSFGSVPMIAIPGSQAPVTALQNTSKIETEMYYLNDSGLGTASGTQVVSVTLPSAPTGGVAANCASFFGLGQYVPDTEGAAYSGNSTPASITLTTATSGDLIIDSFAGGMTSAKTASPNSGQNVLTNAQLVAAGIFSGSSYEISTTASVNVGWAETASREAYAAVAFKPLAVASYAVTTAVSPGVGGTIALSPSASSYSSGTNVTATATPSTYYSFSSFNDGNGNTLSTTNPYTFSVTAASTIQANFTQNQCTLTVNVVGNGTATPASGSYACGSTVNLKATPTTGYNFASWAGSGYASTSSSSGSFTLTGNTTETVTFVAGTVCTLGTSVTGSGSISLSPAGGSYSCGQQVIVTATPATEWSFSGFTGALTGSTNPQTITLNANSNVAAAFTQTSFPVNVTVSGPGTVAQTASISANSDGSWPTGTQVTLTATPTAGDYFVGFTGGLVSTTNPATVTVGSTMNIVATFAAPTITQDAVSHADTTGSASVLTWTHTLGTGTSRAVVIEVGSEDTVASPDANAVVTGVYFNGVYATPVPNSLEYGGTSGMAQTQLFYLTDSELPATAGTYTVEVDLSGSVAGISAGAISLFGVNQGPPEAVAINRITSGCNPCKLSTSITTLTNNAWLIDAVEDGELDPLTVNTGQTVAWTGEATGGTGGSSTEVVATAGAATIGWSADANRIVESVADFPPATSAVPASYTLTTATTSTDSNPTPGTITTNPGISTFPTQSAVLLTATPALGYSFSSWTGDTGSLISAANSTVNPVAIVMDANHTVTANFTSTATCKVNFTVIGSGTVTPASGSTYNCGTTITMTATPGNTYAFTSWSGDFSSTDNPATFTINANSNITVEFDQIPQCTLTMATVGTGTLSPGTSSYACGSTVTLAATQTSSSWPFSGWSGDFAGTANPATVTLNGNMSITGTFTQGTTCTLTTSVTGSGTVTPSSASYLCGTQVALAAVPNAHYLFSSWGGALSGSTTPTTLTLSGNLNVTATFAYDTSGVTGDPRTVVEPKYPAVCSVLNAQQLVSSPTEVADTTRVQNALNACTAGQAVEFSPSTDGNSYNAFVIAPITLPAGVTMLIDPEVTILGSIKYADYSCNTSESWCNPLINIAPNSNSATGSGIMGLGTIDGRGGTKLTDKGESWWATGSDVRPRLIYLSSHATGASSDYFTAYKVTLKNSPKFHLSGVGNNWTVWGVKIFAPPDSPNTDGIDPSGSSNVTIMNSYINDGDDWISPKADSGHIAGVTINGVHTYSGHGISIGSETNAGLNNMLVENVAIDNGFGGTSYDSIRIKSDSSRGGEVYDVLYKNICIENGGDTIVIDPFYSSGTGTLYPNFHDITFSNVHKLVHSSSYKSTMIGYTLGAISNPLTVTLDNVAFDGDGTNDYKAPSNFYNVQFNYGPGPVSMASFLTTDAATSSNLITTTNNITNSSESAYDCTGAFVYLAGDLTAPTASATGNNGTAPAGSSYTLTAVLQNVVSPVIAGTLTYYQNSMPTGTIQILEGSNIVGTGTITSGSRLTYITIPASYITAGTHTYTAYYTGAGSYAALSFGSFTLTASANTPVANSQSVSVPYNTSTAITLSASGSGTLAYTVLTNPTNGTLNGTAPNLTYTPTSGYTGTDSFTFTASNGVVSNTATVSITVLAGAPVASSQSVTTAYNTATAITLNATGSGTLTYLVATNPSHGTLSGTAPSLTYTPNASFYGSDSFTFTASNGTVSSPATVSITVLPAAPVASSQTVSTAFNTAASITLSATGNGTMTYSVVTNPTHGVLSGTLPILTYAPTTGYFGADSFTFKANNGTVSNIATVSITVLPTAPVASSQSVSTAFNTAAAITLSATGNGTISYTAGTPTHGTLSGTAPNLTYTPTTGYYGTDSFTFTATNAGGTSTAATVSITVQPAPPVASSQSVSTAFNTAVAITLSATGNGTISYTAGTPTHGTLSGTAPSLTYTPTTGYYGTDSFTFTATNAGGTSSAATVSITVQPAPPVPSSQSVSTAFNTAAAITLSATGNGTISYTVGTPTHGTLSGTAPNLTYTPTTGYYGTDSFTFTATNAGGTSTAATVSITVLPAPPVASSQSVSTAFNTAVAITLSATGNGTISYTVGTPTHGILNGTAPSLIYTPTAGYFGTDSFTFTATNTGGTSTAATVSIRVLPAAPVATSQSVNVAYNAPTTITLAATGNGAIGYTVVANPTHGTLSGTAPSLTYTPTSGYSGSDSFTFTASNGTVSNIATVSITVASEELSWTIPSGSSTTSTVTTGQPATYDLQVAGWVGASGTVTFTCTGVPVDATCTVTPPTATLSGTTVIPIVVTVTTQTGSARMNAMPSPGSTSGTGLPLTLVAGFAVCLLGLRKKYQGMIPWMAIILSISAICLVTGCVSTAHSNAQTPAGSYNLTVTATSNGVSQDVSLTLNVQ